MQGNIKNTKFEIINPVFNTMSLLNQFHHFTFKPQSNAPNYLPKY